MMIQAVEGFNGHVRRVDVTTLSGGNTIIVESIECEYMSDDKSEIEELQKACAHSGCKRMVGREHDYCLKHRD
jgi:hypothetical protein